MKTSLSKIFTQFERFAGLHPMIEGFSIAPLTEYVAKDWVYPVMWVDMQGTSITFNTGEVRITFPVYILDRVERDFSNYKSVMNSTLLSLNDFYAYYTDNECEYGFMFNNSSALTSRAYEFDDIVCGWSMNILTQVADDRNESQIPF